VVYTDDLTLILTEEHEINVALELIRTHEGEMAADLSYRNPKLYTSDRGGLRYVVRPFHITRKSRPFAPLSTDGQSV
jgi:hypothetical protein